MRGIDTLGPQAAHGQAVGVGGDDSELVAFALEQHAGQHRSRLVPRRRRHDLVQRTREQVSVERQLLCVGDHVDAGEVLGRKRSDLESCTSARHSDRAVLGDELDLIGREAAHDEGGKDLVRAGHRRQRLMRIVGMQHRADREKEGELREDHDATEDQGQLVCQRILNQHAVLLHLHGCRNLLVVRETWDFAGCERHASDHGRLRHEHHSAARLLDRRTVECPHVNRFGGSDEKAV